MLKELLNDHQTGMSEFQDDFLVTGRAGGTLYGQYKQSLREVYKRFRGLREESCNYEKLQVEIDEQKHIMNTDPDEFKQRYATIEHKRKIMQCEEAERLIKNTKREFTRFYQQACYLKKQIGSLTDKKRKELDKDMWMFRVKEMMCIDWISSGRIGRNTFEFLHACPDDMKKELLIAMKNQSATITWYENKEIHMLPNKFDDIPEIDFKNFNLLEILDDSSQ